MDSLVPLSKAAKENEHAVIITKRYLKLTQASSAARVAIHALADIVPKARNIPYGIAAYLQTGDGSQFVSMLLKTLYKPIALKQLSTKAYRLPTIGQVEQ